MSADIEKNARDAVAAALAKESASAISVIMQQISMAARHGGDAEQSVAAACRGSMIAVWNANADLPGAAIKVLEALPNISLVSTAGPEQVMTWAMEGMADAAFMAGGENEVEIRTRIEEKFMGAGQIFADFCDKARAKAKGGD